ncbi:MAG: TSUP family transporter, partial [Beijerinckiaceae bacterium]
MSDLLALTFLGLPLSTYLIVAVAAALASIIGGVTGYGSGLLLPLVMVPTIGAEATVPVLGVTAIFTNLGRVAAFRPDIDWSKVWRIALPAAPAVVLGAAFNTWLSGRGVLILLGLTLLAMIPLKRA